MEDSTSRVFARFVLPVERDRRAREDARHSSRRAIADEL
jgi:hypothetical protein